MELVEYLDAAKARVNIASDSKLALAMGQNPAWVYQVRCGKALPSDESMLRLADLAGVSPDVALLDLQRIRARDPRVRSVWANILQRVAVTAAALALYVAPVETTAQFTQGANSPFGAGPLYIIKNRRPTFSAVFRRYFNATFDKLCAAW